MSSPVNVSPPRAPAVAGAAAASATPSKQQETVPVTPAKVSAEQVALPETPAVTEDAGETPKKSETASAKVSEQWHSRPDHTWTKLTRQAAENEAETF